MAETGWARRPWSISATLAAGELRRLPLASFADVGYDEVDSMPSLSNFSFDHGADDFDRRAGLPPDAVAKIASEVAQLAAATRHAEGRSSGLVLDLGAGTGEVGAKLGDILGPERYIALDLALPMLTHFRRRESSLLLLRADASKSWPFGACSCDVIFSSRAAHLLDVDHLFRQAERVLKRPGQVVLGGITREKTSVRSQLRRHLHERLARDGFRGRRRRQSWRAIGQRFSSAGFAVRESAAARWPVKQRPIDSLNAWRSKPGLAGRAMPEEAKNQVLAALEDWAQSQFGDLERPRRAEERYDLLIITSREGP